MDYKKELKKLTPKTISLLSKALVIYSEAAHIGKKFLSSEEVKELKKINEAIKQIMKEEV